jgi:hypothetical protein
VVVLQEEEQPAIPVKPLIDVKRLHAMHPGVAALKHDDHEWVADLTISYERRFTRPANAHQPDAFAIAGEGNLDAAVRQHDIWVGRGPGVGRSQIRRAGCLDRAR